MRQNRSSNGHKKSLPGVSKK